MVYIRISEHIVSVNVLSVGEDWLITVSGVSSEEWREIPSEMRDGLTSSAIAEYKKRDTEFAEWKAKRDAFDKRMGL